MAHIMAVMSLGEVDNKPHKTNLEGVRMGSKYDSTKLPANT